MFVTRTFPQRVYDRVYNLSSREVLNTGDTPADTPPQLAAELKKAVNRLKAEAINLESGRVDYRGLKAAASYADYRRLTAALPQFDLTQLTTREDKLAFWINLYNALVIDAVIAYGVRESITEVKGVFERMAYNVGGYRFNSNDIEHGILRANQGHPYIPGRQFRPDDPRLKFILPALDHRIHFALVCGATSCPPINFYDPERIDSQLDLAARNFLNQEVKIDTAARVVTLPRLLMWYGGDFGGGATIHLMLGDKPGLLRGIAPYITDETGREWLLRGDLSGVRVRFSPYSWKLNAA